MNIFEVADSDGDKLSIDLNDEFAGDGGRFTASVFNPNTSPVPYTSAVFGDDAARALIKALREALPPEETEQAAPVPRFVPKQEGYVKRAKELLDESFSEYQPGDVLHLAYFLAGER